METNRKSKAYEAGMEDGLAWDLDGYASAEEVSKSKDTWDEATINALGVDKFCALVGISPEQWGEDPWRQACHDYNRGCYDGATAPQSERTGLPPGGGFQVQG